MIRVGPYPVTGVLIRRGEFGHRETQGRMPCEDGGRVEVIRLQARECQGLLANLTSEERGLEQILSQNPQREPTLRTHRFWTSNLQNCE